MRYFQEPSPVSTFSVFDFENRYYAGKRRNGVLADIKGGSREKLACVSVSINRYAISYAISADFDEIVEFDTIKEKHQWIADNL